MQILITTNDRLTHGPISLVDEVPDYAAYSGRIATQEALKIAYSAGRFAVYTPHPELPPELPPDWSAFRLALLRDSTFRTWSVALPDTWREDLKMSAIAANAEALQATYDYCKSLSPPLVDTAAAWQKLADDHHIPVKF